MMHQQQGSERTGTPYFQVALRFVIFFSFLALISMQVEKVSL